MLSEVIVGGVSCIVVAVTTTVSLIKAARAEKSAQVRENREDDHGTEL